MTPSVGEGRSERAARTAFLVLVATWAVFLVYFRPASPFEWDEVLFMRAAERFSVPDYAPHAPGYPVYVGAVKVAYLLRADPQLANQMVAIAGAVLLVGLLWPLLRKLRTTPWSAVAAAGVLAMTPALAFNANVGLSDVPATALAVAGALALVMAWDDPRWAWVGGAGAALAAGARPQTLAALLPLGIAVLVRLAVRRCWGALALSTIAGVAVSVACWVPAVLASGGARRYFEAVAILREYVRVEERGYHLPGAPLKEVMEFWLGRPFGADGAAAAFWLLAAAGTWWWWRTGHRRVVAVAGSAAVSYAIVAGFSVNFTTAVRYIIPALPFLAILAAGNVVAPRRAARTALTGVLVAWTLAELMWGWRVYALRREPAPVWSTLTWAAANHDPSRTTVVYTDSIAPHAEWVFSHAGFPLVKAAPGESYDGSLRRDGTVLVASPRPVPGGRLLRLERWRSGRLERLTRARYYDGAVVLAPASGEPAFSTDFQVRENDWELWDYGTVRSGDEGVPYIARISPGDVSLALDRAGFAPRRVERGGLAEALLMPGVAGELIVRAPRKTHAHMHPIELERIGRNTVAGPLSRAYVIPGLVHGIGADGLPRSSRLTLYNPHPQPVPLVVRLLPSPAHGRGTSPVRFQLASGTLRIDEVLGRPELGGIEGSAALLVSSETGGEGARFVAFAETEMIGPTALARRAAAIPGVPIETGVAMGGRVRFRGLANDQSWSESTGFVSPCDTVSVVEVSFFDRGGRRLATQGVTVPPSSQLLVPPPGEGSEVDAVVEVTEGDERCLVYPFALMVERETGSVRYMLPEDPAQPGVGGGKMARGEEGR